MKIILKRDWDYNVAPPLLEKSSQGNFVGRNKERELLTNEILRRSGGAILISGHRGVGKTALVYKALWEAKAKDQNIVVVLLNAAQLETDSKETHISPREIIENLIRRLFSTSRDIDGLNDDVKQKVEILYRKAVAHEFKLVEAYRKQQKESQEDILEKTTSGSFNEQNFRNLVFLVSWTIGILLQLGGSFLPGDWVGRLLPIIMFLPLPYGINLLYKEITRHNRLNETSEKAEWLYQFDNSIGNLEFDLEQVHTAFKKNGLKLVYVLAELDKLKLERVKGVVKYFKNLFTLSDAVFIFVGGEEIYEMGIEPSRPEEYTYFSTRYLLSRPLWKDLVEYFNCIIEEKDLNDGDFEKLIRAISFDAKNDFFDLRIAIKDRITSFDSEHRPIIELQQILDTDIKKAGLHKALTVLFEGKYIVFNPSRWKENELIVKALFGQAHKIILGYSGEKFSDPVHDTLEDSAVRDFNSILLRIGVFTFQDENAILVRGEKVPTRSYVYGISVPVEVPEHINEPTEYEKRFLHAFSNYGQYVLALNNAFIIAKKETEVDEKSFWQHPSDYVQKVNNLGFDIATQFKIHLPIYKAITQHGVPYTYRREDIEQRGEQISSHTKQMLQTMPTIVLALMAKHYEYLRLNLTALVQENLFVGEADPIRSALRPYNPPVLHLPDYSRQVVSI